jgi:uncharacterized delta-60 repeat protein
MKYLYLLIALCLFSVGYAQNAASLDTSFQHGYIDANYGAGSVKVALASNGKIYAVGINSSTNSVVDKLVRFNSTGAIDYTFNKGSGFLNSENVYAIAIQNDNKIIVGGQFSSYNNTSVKSLIRLNEDGSLDNSFNVGLGIGNGYLTSEGKINGIKILEDGKIICFGDFRLLNGIEVSNIVRLNPNGSLDMSFFTGVINCPLNSVQIESSTNKIYIAGMPSSIAGVPNSSLFKGIYRLYSDGQIDTSFNIITDGFNSDVNDMAIQIDGKIIAVGNFTSFGTLFESAFRIIRLNPDGSRDYSFNAKINENINAVDGTLPFPSNESPSLKRVLIKNDGKILVCGLFNRHNNTLTDNNIALLNNDGSSDIAFYSLRNYPIYSRLTDLIIQNDKKIIVGGTHDVLDIYGNYPGDSNYSYVNRLTGQDYYLFKGMNYYDSDLNGCNVNDFKFDGLKFNVTSTNSNSTWFPLFGGTNNILFKNGLYTITPALERPNYFNVTPTSVTVNFPSQASPFVQDFCITPNGAHSDLEIFLIPVGRPASPGFDAKYKLVYRNRGTHVQSGTVNLTFNDATLDFVSANPVVSSQAVNLLSWNFTNLNPFETREILITLNLNSPIETPPLNAGNVLNYIVNISSVQTDETPNDNTFALNQTVVNSFDPNDKTCLQGLTVGTDKVGDYAHYVIRFENSGTYNAQNITIKDVIDTNKFDINTLIPLSGSALFTTKISQGNKVEFLLENINLPYAAGTNTGYVAFKIKTKATLVSGNTFGGLANIYFDYNSAITTNTYTTTIQALSVQDFSFVNYFSLYPNPVSDVLNISKKDDIEISSVHIYNVLGQLMMVIPNAKNTATIDVSNLTSGNYFVKINSDKGTSNTKFIKN